MLILTDCLSRKDDEGYVKIASKIAKKIVEKDPSVRIISVNDSYEFADAIIFTKTFVSQKLIKEMKGKDVLFLSPGSNSLKVSIKLFLLSLYCRSLTFIIVQHGPMLPLIRILFRLSGIKIVCLARSEADFFRANSDNQVYYVRAGIDFNIYNEADKKRKNELRLKYGFKPNDLIITHVGHMKKGRNIQFLIPLSDNYRVLLVTSSTTEQEEDLKTMLQARDNITIIDSYLPNIEEIYQMTDCYVFPVKDIDYCIGVPLSVLEACSCNIPVVTTKFGELAQFDECDCFLFDEFEDIHSVNDKIKSAISLSSKCSNRDKVRVYNWNESIKDIERIVYSHE